MNAKEARQRSMRLIEKQLWSQVSEETRQLIEHAVANEQQSVAINVAGVKRSNYYGMKEDVRLLELLGYVVSNDSVEAGFGTPKQPANYVYIEW